MRYTRLGRRGPKVSVVGLGFWQFGGKSWKLPSTPSQTIHNVLETALEEGINLLDTAEIYGWGRSEVLLGEAVRKVYRGEDVVVATKAAGFRWGGGIVRAAEKSRRRLGVDIDLLQHHWPPPIYATICSVVRGLEEAIEKGYAHYFGVSNYPVHLMEKVYSCTKKYEPVSNQVQYSLAYRIPENDVFPHAKEKGYTIIAWSPLAKGSLAGAHRKRDLAQKKDPVFRAVASDHLIQETLSKISSRLEVSPATVALAWVISKGAVPIPGTRKPIRVREYALAGRIVLSDEDVEALDGASSRYLRVWGQKYGALRFLRLVPGPLQWIFIRGIGGV